MDRAHSTGMLLMIGAAIEFLVFLYGALRRSYLAIALPVTAAMATMTALAFWVGWTMVTMEPEPEEPIVMPAE